MPSLISTCRFLLSSACVFLLNLCIATIQLVVAPLTALGFWLLVAFVTLTGPFVAALGVALAPKSVRMPPWAYLWDAPRASPQMQPWSLYSWKYTGVTTPVARYAYLAFLNPAGGASELVQRMQTWLTRGLDQ